MAKNDPQEAYERALTANLTRTIDWLKFAEAKNGALLAFVSAWTVAIANLIAKDGGPPAAFVGVLPVAAYLFIVAGLVLLVSIVPRISLSSFFRSSGASNRPVNYLFYGDIADKGIVEFPDKIKAKYLPSDGEAATDGYLTDLATQLHVNSTIARFKFRMFRVAGWITVAGLAVLAWPIVKAVF